MRLFDFLYRQLEQFPLNDAFAHKINGEWKKYSTVDAVKIVNQLSQGLVAFGIKPNDKIAIVSEGRPEWVFVDLAVQQVGAVLVPLYPTLSKANYKTILKETGSKIIFISNSTILANVKPAVDDLGFNTIYAFNKINGITSWLEVLRMGKGKHKEEVEARKNNIKPEDLCTIIYTSGTSGTPKGVMLSHLNIYSNVIENTKNVLLKPRDKALSFLPLNHIYEKGGVAMYIYLGIRIYFSESLESIADNLKEVKPHTFNTVPRLLEKVYDKILKTGASLPGIKKGIFNWAISVGLRYDPSVNQGILYNRQLKLASKLVFSKWREALGGNIKHIQCGASALQPRLARIFWAADIKVLEGYGLTETSPVISANSVKDFKFGTVGKLYKNLELKFGEENEIMVKGPSVMMGYYKNDVQTKEAFDEDGWFKTGDVGKLENGYLVLTDRKKELFKTSGGMYIAPQQIENKLKESILIDQVMVVGEGEKFPAALIVPNFEELEERRGDGDLAVMSLNELLIQDKILKLFQAEVDRVNEGLGKWEQIKQFRLVNKSWTPEGGQLTPTMKLKRRIIKEECAQYIEKIYKGSASMSTLRLDDLDIEDIENMSLEDIEKLEGMESL